MLKETKLSRRFDHINDALSWMADHVLDDIVQTDKLVSMEFGARPTEVVVSGIPSRVDAFCMWTEEIED